MLPAAKQQKLSFNLKENEICNAESGFHSQIDFSSTTSSSSSLREISRRKSCLPSFHGSYQQQQSFSDSQQSPSLGYESNNFGASSSNILISPAKNRKRKSNINETDENFYNSYQFVSPVKIRKRDDSTNRAKLILKEKCSTENVILSSTPIRTEQKASKWGKFRSFHPEKLLGKSLDDHEQQADTATAAAVPVGKNNESTFNFSSFNLSNASFNNDIPLENIQQLLAAEIKTEPKTVVNDVNPSTTKATTKTVKSVVRNTLKPSYVGKARVDILGLLFESRGLVARKILDQMDAESLLRISHVSQNYRRMILSNKNYESKRKIYLNHHRSILENKYPACGSKRISSSASSKQVKKKVPFGESNLVNQSQMILRQRPVTPPQSPQRSKQQNVVSKKCPRCQKPAVIKRITIRHSPRKIHNKFKEGTQGLLRLSPHNTGRVTKSPKTFLSKTSIHVARLNEALPTNNNACLTLPLNFAESRRSSSSSCDSPSSGSEDLSGDSSEIYEFAVCPSINCRFKFCVKCLCKSHSKSPCKDLPVPSPSRPNKTMAACTNSSLKSLRRLAYD